MNDEREPKLEYCPYCGAKVRPDNPYCPECGKSIYKRIEANSTEKKGRKKEKKFGSESGKYQRKCPGCGSLISSNVLEQCPICNTRLEPVPERVKSKPQQHGLIFTDKEKLELEENLRLKKDSWDVKEGFKVFGNCILIYITTRLLLFTLLTFQFDPEAPIQTTFALDIFSILLSQLPEVVFGIYPLWYIFAYKHQFQKLGLLSSSKKLTSALFLGIIGAIALVFVNFLNDSILNLFFASGFDLFGLESYLNEEYQIIQNANLIFIILLIILLGLGAISTELVFRGVLHNTLKEKFGKSWIAIILTALIYAAIYAFFLIPVGLIFFVVNLVSFLLLGLLYEIDDNLYNTIIASVLYNVIMVLNIVLL
ncbi:MAG: type II CAAX prenyl endopeptidase Rce1 family protein [Promethearchaeia archaeon]